LTNHSLQLNNCVFVAPKQPSSGVKGRLKENIAFWEQIKASNWVLRVIREGYALPLIDIPEKRMLDNHRSAIIMVPCIGIIFPMRQKLLNP
jgi:hypothetical protein